MEPTSLGGRVRDCRKARGWTQKELAGDADISITFLSELENDHRAPGAGVLLRLADALGVSLDYLVRGVGDERPAPRSLELPVELAELADEEGWSFRELKDLLVYRDMVVARRTQPGTPHDADRTLTREQWRQLHDWLRKSPIR